MSNSTYHTVIFTKLIKIMLNIIVLVLYRNGDLGFYLGATYNKNRDAEILVAGVFIGYLVYNLISLLAQMLDSRSLNESVVETLMNLLGSLLWLTCGGIVIQFWLRFIPSNHFTETNPTPVGIAMGAISVINSAIYMADTFLSFANYRSANY